MTDQATSAWRSFVEQARSGELYLDPDVAKESLVACDELLLAYDGLVEYAYDAQRVGGFGAFGIADELADLFHKQATGEPDSIDQVILDTIAVVKDMREIMQLSIDRLTEQDSLNAGQVSSAAVDLGSLS
ncbi:hypothetical protein ACF1BU_38795 [Streptomyces sp. NPDC014724]|uniref:hypothetical protein n=1 Tax=Streptomyces sp. NPDC014724 TaxID=3364882 RepID=UPI00370297EC